MVTCLSTNGAPHSDNGLRAGSLMEFESREEALTGEGPQMGPQFSIFRPHRAGNGPLYVVRRFSPDDQDVPCCHTRPRARINLSYSSSSRKIQRRIPCSHLCSEQDQDGPWIPTMPCVFAPSLMMDLNVDRAKLCKRRWPWLSVKVC